MVGQHMKLSTRLPLINMIELDRKEFLGIILLFSPKIYSVIYIYIYNETTLEQDWHK